MMKKIVSAAALVLTLIWALAVLTGCEKEDANMENIIDSSSSDLYTDAVLNGGWNVSDAVGAPIPDEVRTAFDKAAEGFDDMNLEPVAFLSSQVVAGMNYAVLSKTVPTAPDSVASLKIAIIYSKLDGTAEILSVSDFSVADFNTGEINQAENEILAGGWQTADTPALELPKEAKEAFDSACAGFDVYKIEPLAYIGSQVVAGINMAYVVRMTSADTEGTSTLGVATLYRNLSGNADFTAILPLDIAEYRN